jgi:hypothetical protein
MSDPLIPWWRNWARKAAYCVYLNQLDVNLRLAQKARSQCRATLETLGAIKNPQPANFSHQANLAHGPRQVNNEATQLGEVPGAKNSKGAKQTIRECSCIATHIFCAPDRAV